MYRETRNWSFNDDILNDRKESNVDLIETQYKENGDQIETTRFKNGDVIRTNYCNDHKKHGLHTEINSNGSNKVLFHNDDIVDEKITKRLRNKIKQIKKEDQFRFLAKKLLGYGGDTQTLQKRAELQIQEAVKRMKLEF